MNILSSTYIDLASLVLSLPSPFQLVEMIVDLCSGDSVDHPPAAHTGIPPTSLPPDAHICRGAARLPRGARVLNTGQPLQVGGLAHPLPDHVSERWNESHSLRSFHGCVRNLRINREVCASCNHMYTESNHVIATAFSRLKILKQVPSLRIKSKKVLGNKKAKPLKVPPNALGTQSRAVKMSHLLSVSARLQSISPALFLPGRNSRLYWFIAFVFYSPNFLIYQ